MNLRKDAGFTLVEIMVVVAIIAILAGIAWPSYQDSVRKSRRADGKEALLSAAAVQEKIYLQRNRYSGDIAELGGNTSSEGYYTLSVSQAGGNTTYLLTATATGAQASDTKCARLTVNHIGLQKAYNSSDAETDECW